ncbi:PREDICTED: G-type lectin S-receptor-like serine/threonine-protein kinase At1g11300 isoform X2 [Lupinus angustifolius]|uniref:G-type lectin S-receptor-like serine/threonine-protein kinase At1g11300 isoform X2 n=1 Tax=Lupinus angustifolius TaxID=3871 RepID=UPI00092E4AB7|nr:PREDICTED: G-type lectin S-receptor-like serine/threonine-protein kinase At1g11300 isoform X2 [Lupinus angustifolius]
MNYPKYLHISAKKLIKLMGFLSQKIYLPIFWVIFLSFYICLSSSIDTITSSKYIKDNETITSNNTEFILGFFSPGNSSNRYLAIWYLFPSNIVWIANRDQPVNDSSGVAKIHKDGNFVVMNEQNLMIWSTNVTSNDNYSNSSAKLEDSGNLVLYDEFSGETIWDSFTHPADAAMPGMKIAANPITGKKIEYISWKSPSDPSTGYFTGSLERLNAPEVFFWYNKTKPYWRTGPWNGNVFLGSPRMLTDYLAGWKFHIEDDGTQYLTYNYANPLNFGILSVTPHGTLKLVSFVNKTEVANIEVGQSECDIYGKCGPFGNCDNSTSPICNCFNGFEPRNQEEWNRENWTSGCVRKVELQCYKVKNGSEVEQDEFLVYHNMKVPDFTQWSGAYQDKCKIDCLANCSCLAYAYDSGVGCMYWIGDLIDLQHFSYGGIDLYMRTPYSLIGRSKKGYKVLIGSIIGAIGIIILAICAYLLWRKWTAKQTGKGPQNTSIEDQNQMKLEELPLFDFESVAVATNNFHLANMLGKGGFGPVYKGLLENGQEIAVKRLSKASTQGLEEFMNEVVVISKLQHRNLVRILGCCIERDEQMLIYEFMPNKSLDAFIFDPIQKKVLKWKKRFNIIEGIARGILYLHRDSRLRIIHRDLKASNILLDDEMNPKISDFGLARIFKGDEDSEVNTRRVVGTYGYMPPEYAMEGLFSEKSDVYSFGVLLLEIVSGRRNTSFYNDEQPLGLVGLTWNLWNEDNMMPIIDEEVWDPCFENSILRCIHIGLLCVQEVAKDRPTISTVVLMLISEITHLPSPRKVAFVQKQKYSSSTSSQKSQASSNNNVTISEIQGR